MGPREREGGRGVPPLDRDGLGHFHSNHNSGTAALRRDAAATLFLKGGSGEQQWICLGKARRGVLEIPDFTGQGFRVTHRCRDLDKGLPPVWLR
jgi:hypothetical protein